jgi:hypothetical protein
VRNRGRHPAVAASQGGGRHGAGPVRGRLPQALVEQLSDPFDARLVERVDRHGMQHLPVGSAERRHSRDGPRWNVPHVAILQNPVQGRLHFIAVAPQERPADAAREIQPDVSGADEHIRSHVE